VSPVIYNRLPAIAAGARPIVDTAVAKAAMDTEALAKVTAPIDTGNLRNSIASDKVRDLTWRVTANAEYSIYVEMGTRKMSAQPFLDPSLRASFASLTKALGKIV
jgi:HK97 gp10 family phage protein